MTEHSPPLSSFWNIGDKLLRFMIRKFYGRYTDYGNQRHTGGAGVFLNKIFGRTGLDKKIRDLNHRDTEAILAIFPEVLPETSGADRESPPSRLENWVFHEAHEALTGNFSDVITQKQEPADFLGEAKTPSFTVVIPFYAHLDFLVPCLRSVEKAVRAFPKSSTEVIIVNDDPRFSEKELAECLPGGLRGKTRILVNEQNMGICATFNRAIDAAQNDWIVHLDCDDILMPKALSQLVNRIRSYPQARYISSRMVDIKESGGTLRCRLRPETPEQLMSHGMVAGHLKVIRKDLFADIGGYLTGFEGCQDYEFALRASLYEPLLFIPDYLYGYRWHGNTQSVSRARRQTKTTQQIRGVYLLAAALLSGFPLPVRFHFQGREAVEWEKVFHFVSSPDAWLDIAIKADNAPSEDLSGFALSLAGFLLDLEAGETSKEGFLNNKFSFMKG